LNFTPPPIELIVIQPSISVGVSNLVPYS